MKKNLAYLAHFELKLTCTGLLLLVLFASVSVVFLKTTQPTRFMYVLGVGGEFIKVDLGSQQVVDHGDLSQDRRAAKLLDDYIRWGPLIREVLYNPNKGVLYVETQAGTAHDEAGDVVERSRVLGFKLPNFALVGAIHEEIPVTGLEGVALPTLLVSQDWEQLLYFYGEKENGKRPVVIFEWYDAETLKLIERQQRELPGNWRELDQEARRGYWDQNLGPLYYGKFTWPEQKPTWYRFTGSLPAEADRLVKQYPSFVFNPTFVNSKVVLWESKTREHIHRYQGKKDGKEQEIEEKSQVDYSTGRFVVFDQRGKKLFELNDKELAGDYPKTRTVSPDGRTMYFAIGQTRLYAIDLTKKKPPVPIETHGVGVMSAIYIFADW